jgi:hypothetical protein
VFLYLFSLRRKTFFFAFLQERRETKKVKKVLVFSLFANFFSSDERAQKKQSRKKLKIVQTTSQKNLSPLRPKKVQEEARV